MKGSIISVLNSCPATPYNSKEMLQSIKDKAKFLNFLWLLWFLFKAPLASLLLLRIFW
jgi:hypothetical protein